MLSKKSGKLFIFVIRWCRICGGMPYIWDNRRGQLRVTKKSQSRWSTVFCVQIFLCVFTYFRLFQIVSDYDTVKCANNFSINKTLNRHVSRQYLLPRFKSVGLDAEITYCFLHTIIYAFLVSVNLNTLANRKEIALFTNSYLKFTSHFRDAYTIRLGRLWKNGCEDLIQLLITAAISAPVIPTIHFLINPWHPQYLTSLLILHEESTQELDLTKMIYKYGIAITVIFVGIFATFQVFFVWIFTSTLLFITTNVTITAFVFRSAIREMTIEPPKVTPVLWRRSRRGRYFVNYHTKEKLRTITNLVKCYRSFQIFERLVHLCFSKLAFTIEVLQIAFTSGIIIILLRFSSKISTASIVILSLFIVVSLSIWMFLLNVVGEFKSKTRQCYDSWKHLKLNFVDEIRYMRVARKSFHPISFYPANIYEMQIKHVPYFLYGIACGVILWHSVYHDLICKTKTFTY